MSKETETSPSAGAKPRYQTQTRAYMMPKGRWQADLTFPSLGEALTLAHNLAGMGHITRVFDLQTRREATQETGNEDGEA